MNLKTIFLAGSFLMLTAGSFVSAQETVVPKRINVEEAMTPLKPENGQPYVFSSQADLEAAQAKIESIKMDIRHNIDNPERVKVMREKLWRMENAIVKN